MEKSFFVYVLASKPNGVLYIGVTSDLVKRVHQHRSGEVDGFSKKYNVKQLVFFEEHADSEAAITREKQLKKWKRDWKVELIENSNPTWRDLYHDII
ncbi:MAG: GIY-YIG nuclease family protein [Pseudomonadota bacterium]